MSGHGRNTFHAVREEGFHGNEREKTNTDCHQDAGRQSWKKKAEFDYSLRFRGYMWKSKECDKYHGDNSKLRKIKRTYRVSKKCTVYEGDLNKKGNPMSIRYGKYLKKHGKKGRWNSKNTLYPAYLIKNNKIVRIMLAD